MRIRNRISRHFVRNFWPCMIKRRKKLSSATYHSALLRHNARVLANQKYKSVILNEVSQIYFRFTIIKETKVNWTELSSLQQKKGLKHSYNYRPQSMSRFILLASLRSTKCTTWTWRKIACNYSHSFTTRIKIMASDPVGKQSEAK